MSSSPPLVVADRYRLVAPLGQGGMGRVWRATDVVLHREVAIKELVPPPGLTPGERQEMRERSLREARAIARLNNVNVVRVFDVLRTDADPWIVMEYVPSRSLQDTLAADGPYSAVRTAEIGLGVLNALRAAHRAGVVHRDVKPGNVLIGADGRVVLTDFGLATVPGDPNVTRTGLVLGSPAYIAPERARDGSAGPAADLWSLGATLYAAVEGASPFARPSAIATLAALATENPPPARNAGPLKPVLNGLLRKDPTHRINAEEAERLLLRATGRRSKMSFPMSPTMRRPGVGRDRSALTGGTASTPVVPGPRPPIARAGGPTGRTPVLPGPNRPAGPPVTPGRPSTSGERPPIFAPGKAPVGRPAADTPTRVDGPKAEPPRMDATRVDGPKVDATRVDGPPVQDDKTTFFGTRPGAPSAAERSEGLSRTSRGAEGGFTAADVAANRRKKAAPEHERSLAEATSLIPRVVPEPPAEQKADPTTKIAMPMKRPPAEQAGEQRAPGRPTDHKPGADKQTSAAQAPEGTASAEQKSAQQTSAEQESAEQESAQQTSAEQTPAAKTVAEQASSEKSAAGQAPAGQAAAGQAAAGSTAAGQAAAGSTAAGQATAGQATAGQATAGQATAGQATTGQATTGQATAAGQAAAGQDAEAKQQAPTEADSEQAETEPTSAKDETAAEQAPAKASKTDTPTPADQTTKIAEPIDQTTKISEPPADRTTKISEPADRTTKISESADRTTKISGPPKKLGKSARKPGKPGKPAVADATQVVGSPKGAKSTSARSGGLKPDKAAQSTDDAKTSMITPKKAKLPAARIDEVPDDPTPVPSFSRPNRPAWAPMPVSQTPGITVFGTRLTYGQAAIGGGIVLLVLVLLIVLIGNTVGDDGDDNPGGPNAVGPTASAGSAPPSGSATSPATSPSQAATPSSPPGLSLPSTWRIYADGSGYKIPLPKNASISQNGSETEIRWANRYLLIDQTDSPKGDALADWREQEQSRAGSYRSYERVRIESVPNYFKQSADWEFYYTTSSGNRQHAVKRNIIVNGNRAYSISWYVSPEDWNASQNDLKLIYQGFQPKK